MKKLLFLLVLLTGCAGPIQGSVLSDIHRGVASLSEGRTICTVQESKSRPITYSYQDGCIHYDSVKLGVLRDKYGYELIVAMAAHEAAHADGANEDEADQEAGCILAQEGLELGPVIQFLKDRGEPDTRAALFLKGSLECAGHQLAISRPPLPF